MRAVHMIVGVLLLSAVSGCVDDAATTEPLATQAEAADDPSTPTSEPPVVEEPPASEPPADPPSSPPAAPPTSPTQAAPTQPPAPRIEVVEADFKTTARAMSPCVNDPPTSTPVPPEEMCPRESDVSPAILPIIAKPMKATLVASWSPPNEKVPPARLLIRLLAANGTETVTGVGASPLALDVPVDGLTPADYTGDARPDGPGAMASQTVHFVLTLEY